MHVKCVECIVCMGMKGTGRWHSSKCSAKHSILLKISKMCTKITFNLFFNPRKKKTSKVKWRDNKLQRNSPHCITVMEWNINRTHISSSSPFHLITYFSVSQTHTHATHTHTHTQSTSTLISGTSCPCWVQGNSVVFLALQCTMWPWPLRHPYSTLTWLCSQERVNAAAIWKKNECTKIHTKNKNAALLWTCSPSSNRQSQYFRPS